ncbi:hypothetical protein [Hydrogenophaga soli]
MIIVNVNNFMWKLIFALCVAVFCLELCAKQVAEGIIPVNGKALKAVLFDDAALDPSCRDKHGNAKQAMFYLNEKSFAHGCWIFHDNEIHTQMTRYDNRETRAYVFALAAFKMTNDPEKKENTSNNSSLRSKCQELYQAWVFNGLLEEACNLNLGVSMKIGMSAKAICKNMSEIQRKSWTAEVAESVKKEIDEIRREDFCRRNTPEYKELAK